MYEVGSSLLGISALVGLDHHLLSRWQLTSFLEGDARHTSGCHTDARHSDGWPLLYRGMRHTSRCHFRHTIGCYVLVNAILVTLALASPPSPPFSFLSPYWDLASWWSSVLSSAICEHHWSAHPPHSHHSLAPSMLTKCGSKTTEKFWASLGKSVFALQT